MIGTPLRAREWRRNLVRAAVCAALLSAAPAKATLIYTFGNINLSGFTGPYATVSVTRNSSTTATIAFDSLTNGGFIYLMGGNSVANLNVNGTYTLGAVSESNGIAGFMPIFVDNTPGNADGFGFFNLSLNDFDGFTHAATHIAFSLTNTSGTWSGDSDVLTPNSGGFFAAAHVFACAVPGCSTTSSAAATGFAATDGPGTPLSAPGSLLSLATVLAAIGFGARRRLRR